MPPRDHRMYRVLIPHLFSCTFIKISELTFDFYLFLRSAFFLFCADFRPKIKAENPGMSIGDTAKKLGEMWNSSSAEEKQPYERKAAKLKEKYDKVGGRTGLVRGKVVCVPAPEVNHLHPRAGYRCLSHEGQGGVRVGCHCGR